MGPRGLQELSCRMLPLFVAPFWAHLGPSWALLGPSRGVQEGILRQILGLEGLILGCKVAKRYDVKNIKKPEDKYCLLVDFWKQRAFRKLAKWLFGGLVVGWKPCRERLGCHVGFELGSTRQVRASCQPNLVQGACMLEATWGQMGWKT